MKKKTATEQRYSFNVGNLFSGVQSTDVYLFLLEVILVCLYWFLTPARLSWNWDIDSLGGDQAPRSE